MINLNKYCKNGEMIRLYVAFIKDSKSHLGVPNVLRIAKELVRLEKENKKLEKLGFDKLNVTFIIQFESKINGKN